MIRRNDGSDWLIIEQVEHARLAAQIARAWDNSSSQSLVAATQLAWGVEHHDDGWHDWDRAPRLDPATGIPREFVEMRMRDSTSIWSRSIDICSAVPLPGIGVSCHFSWLAASHRAQRERAASHEDEEDRQAVDRFLDDQSRLRAQLKDKLLATGEATEEDFGGLSTRSFRTVQFFDRLSLWLCCAPRHEPAQMAGPNDEAITFAPRSSRLFTIEPYCLIVDELELRVNAKRLPARAYLDDAEFQATLDAAATISLDWRLEAA